MTHTINYNPEDRIIEIRVQGDLSLNEVKEIISESRQIAKDQDCYLVLNDMRQAIWKLSVVEVYEIPNILKELLSQTGLHAHKYKRAFVVTDDQKNYNFFETVSANRGQTAKLFFDIDEARKWLLED